MQNEELVNRIGMAFIAAGHALVGTVKLETKTTTATVGDKSLTETTTKVEPAKRKRRTKAEVEASKVKAAPVEDDFAAEDIVEAEVVNAAPTIDQDTLKKALVAYAKTNGKEKAFGILGKYHAKKVADLDPKLYNEVYEQVAVNA